MMLSFPLSAWDDRVNATLHGRSVHRPVDVPGHNVFKGYSTWEKNGHIGVGDAVDLFAGPGTPVLAMHDGTITDWRNDASRLEVVYVEGGPWLTVYAHVNFNEQEFRVGGKIVAGQKLATVRSDLNDPHLHLEVWKDGKAVAGRTPKALLDALKSLTVDADGDLADEWATAAQRWCHDHGITDGLRPRDPVTRQEAWQMLMDLADEVTKR